LVTHELPFLVGGTYAFTAYTGIVRETKDLDLFCKAGDLPRILKTYQDAGFHTEITDERWLAKIFKKADEGEGEGENPFIDLIFGSKTGTAPVDDSWFRKQLSSDVLGVKCQFVAPEELIWSKCYRMNRYKFDGADVINLFLKTGKDLDWKLLLTRMEQHWEVLLSHLLIFRFVYPADRGLIPGDILAELVSRVNHQLELPIPKDKVCRGRLLSNQEYETAIGSWGYKSFT
jgi:hypothetical protein